MKQASKGREDVIIETILYLRLAGTYDHFMAHNEGKFNAT